MVRGPILASAGVAMQIYSTALPLRFVDASFG